MLEAGGRAQVFLPWAGFEGRSGAYYLLGAEDQTNRARTLVAPTHPRWQSLEDADRALHARNAFEVLGLDLCHPSSLLLCWTPDGCQGAETRSSRTGGTATAIVLAEMHGIPVVNMALQGWEQRLWAYWSLVAPSRHWDFGVPIATAPRPEPEPKRKREGWTPRPTPRGRQQGERIGHSTMSGPAATKLQRFSDRSALLAKWGSMPELCTIAVSRFPLGRPANAYATLSHKCTRFCTWRVFASGSRKFT
jgi:hypothetical protein